MLQQFGARTQNVTVASTIKQLHGQLAREAEATRASRAELHHLRLLSDADRKRRKHICAHSMRRGQLVVERGMRHRVLRCACTAWRVTTVAAVQRLRAVSMRANLESCAWAGASLALAFDAWVQAVVAHQLQAYRDANAAKSRAVEMLQERLEDFRREFSQTTANHHQAMLGAQGEAASALGVAERARRAAQRARSVAQEIACAALVRDRVDSALRAWQVHVGARRRRGAAGHAVRRRRRRSDLAHAFARCCEWWRAAVRRESDVVRSEHRRRRECIGWVLGVWWSCAGVGQRKAFSARAALALQHAYSLQRAVAREHARGVASALWAWRDWTGEARGHRLREERLARALQRLRRAGIRRALAGVLCRWGAACDEARIDRCQIWTGRMHA